MSRPGTLVWFAHHEARLAWRDWLAMMTAGRRRRVRTVAIALIVFVTFMHFVAYSMVGRFADAVQMAGNAALLHRRGKRPEDLFIRGLALCRRPYEQTSHAAGGRGFFR